MEEMSKGGLRQVQISRDERKKFEIINCPRSMFSITKIDEAIHSMARMAEKYLFGRTNLFFLFTCGINMFIIYPHLNKSLL